MKNPFHFKKKNMEMTVRYENRSLKEAEKAPLKRPGRQYKEKEIPPDPYYVKLAKRTRIARQTVTVLLILFAIGMTFLFTGEITRDQFSLMFRNMGFSFPGENTEFSTVQYDADLKMDFAAYKNTFAVAGTKGMKLYDHRGNILLEKEYSMKNPKISKGEKYIMVYDPEGKQYYICNSVSVLQSAETEYLLHFADMSDAGVYLTVTSSPKYLSVITVYSKNFQKMKELKIDRYPLAAELSEDGKRMLFLSYDINKKGFPEAYLTVYSLEEQTSVIGEYVYTDFPLGAKLLEDFSVAVLFPGSIHVYDESLRSDRYYTFDDKIPEYFCFGREYASFVFPKNEVLGEYEILTVPYTEEQTVKKIPYTGRIEKMTVLEERLYLFTSKGIEEYNFETERFLNLQKEAPKKLISSKDGTLFACYGNKAENVGNILKEESDKPKKTE